MWVCSLILFPVVVALCICIKNEFNTTKSDCKKSFITYTLLKTLIREWKDKSQIGRQYFNLIYLIYKLYLEYMESSKNSATNKLLFVVQSLSLSMFLQPHGWKHASLPCLSLSPRICSNSCPLSRWCQPTISASVVPFFFCPQSFPASGSFPMSQFFASSGQSIWSFSFSTSPSSEYLGLISFRIDWLDLQCVAESWAYKCVLNW